MSRTLNQQMADAHERDIAEDIEGPQHKGSGNQWHKPMDASNGERITPFPIAADGKATLGKSISVTRDMWLKAVAQTFNKIPTIWLRFYRDESLREVSTDLVVIERRDFNEILKAARNWEGHLKLVKAAGHSEVLPLSVLGKQALHAYTSTACDHAQRGEGAEYLHERCRDTCKFCDEPCNCSCHHRPGCDCCR